MTPGLIELQSKFVLILVCVGVISWLVSGNLLPILVCGAAIYFGKGLLAGPSS